MSRLQGWFYLNFSSGLEIQFQNQLITSVQSILSLLFFLCSVILMLPWACVFDMNILSESLYESLLAIIVVSELMSSFLDHCMVNFIKENLLGSIKEFRNRFINPIQNGQCADSTMVDVRVMKKRAHILYEMLAGCVQVQMCSI